MSDKPNSPEVLTPMHALYFLYDFVDCDEESVHEQAESEFEQQYGWRPEIESPGQVRGNSWYVKISGQVFRLTAEKVDSMPK